MTREEAKRRMEICRNFLANNYSDMGEPNFTAFEMAIQALSQEPCETDVELENTERMWFTTPSGKRIEYIKADVLDKIRAEIERLHYHPKLDFIKNDEVVEMALDIIDKYKGDKK